MFFEILGFGKPITGFILKALDKPFGQTCPILTKASTAFKKPKPKQ